MALKEVAEEQKTIKKLPYEEFKKIFSRVPRLTVEVVVLTPEGVVFTKRSISPYKGMWHVPGGTVMYKETLESAVRRVAQDEIGVEVEIEKFLGYMQYPSEEKEQGWGWPVGMYFLTKIKSGTLRGSEQGEEIKIFKTLPENIIPEQKIFLEKNVQL